MVKKHVSLAILVLFGAALIFLANWYSKNQPEKLFGFFLVALLLSIIVIPLLLIAFGTKEIVKGVQVNAEIDQQNSKPKYNIGKIILNTIYIVIGIYILQALFR